MLNLTQNTARTVGLKPWKPGQSGNPGGRPAVLKELQELARTHTDEAIMALVSVMRDKRAPAAARVFASNSILDRGWGKAPQSVEVSGSLLTRETMIAILMELSDNQQDRLAEHLQALAGREEP